MKINNLEQITSILQIKNTPVYKSEYVSKVNEDGASVLAWLYEGKVLVHPDNWDEFLVKLEEIALDEATD